MPTMNTHVPRTLDESYHLGLSVSQLATRNDDQVLSKAEGDEDKKCVLMVSQLWLWRIGKIILTACPDTRGANDTKSLFVDHLVSEMNNLSPQIKQTVTSEQLTAWIMSECINFLDRPCMAGLQEPVLQTFEKAVANTFENVQDYMRQGGPGKNKMDIEVERRIIHDISDIRDELGMISNILNQQERVWKEFWSEYSHKDSIDDSYLRQILERPATQLRHLKDRVQDIVNESERVERWILVQLDLKTKYASLKEAQNSTTLNTTVIGFTVITVVFTPLSFIASLFALPIDRFQQQQVEGGSTSVYRSSYIGRWMSKSSHIRMSRGTNEHSHRRGCVPACYSSGCLSGALFA